MNTGIDAQPRRYFDHAATSFPKPPGVAEAVTHYIEQVGVSAGRGSYREAVESGQLLQQVRLAVRRALGARPADHVIFALNGTDALNIAIKSIVRPGAHVVTTAMDHNSVLRPLSALRQRLRVEWNAVAPDPQTTIVDPAAVATAIRPETALVVVSHASNVTGALQPVETIAAACRAAGVPLLVDAAQSAGHTPIDFAGWGLDLLATPGHKGLLGPLGTGILIIRAGVEQRMATFREGGTGSASEQPVQPESLPDKFEAGSHNAPGLAGLLAALRWIEQRTVAALRQHEVALMERMIAVLDSIPGLTWYGPRDTARRVGVFSVRLEELPPAELATVLDQHFGIQARSGLHCAPLAHRTIGTDALGGTTRLSLGAFHLQSDVDAVGSALLDLVRAPAVGVNQ